jgi:two-component system nitrate/nitrite response regulator NarL
VSNLVLGDDQGIFLDALSTVLAQRGYRIGAVARSSAEMIAFVRSQQPDACLIDWAGTRPEPAPVTIGRVRDASAGTAILVLAADPDGTAAARAIDAGAAGYVHQSRSIDALLSALDRVLQGELVVDVPDVARLRGQRTESYPHLQASRLTSRERECLAMLVAGLDTEAMMAQLGVARTTVRTHLQSVLTKLGVHSRLEAASFAVRHGLLERWSQDADPADGGPGTAGQPAGPQPARRDPASLPAAWDSRGERAVAG